MLKKSDVLLFFCILYIWLVGFTRRVFMFFDSHCHLDMMVLEQERELLNETHRAKLDEVMAAILAAGVKGLVQVGVDLPSCENVIFLTKRYPSVFGSCALHPCECNDETWCDAFARVESLVAAAIEHKIVAVGETGLDFYHEPYDALHQERAFRRHIELALTHKLPVIVHSRNASDQTIRILQEYQCEGLTGVLHCFSHDDAVAQAILQMGLYIGLGAYITYPKNKDLRSLVATLPVDRLLLETDAPFLPPQSLRGKPNTPAYIPLFAPLVADLLGISCDELALKTTSNAMRLFKGVVV